MAEKEELHKLEEDKIEREEEAPGRAEDGEKKEEIAELSKQEDEPSRDEVELPKEVKPPQVEPPQKEEEPPQKEEEPPQVEPPQKEEEPPQKEEEPPQVEPPQKEEEPPQVEPPQKEEEPPQVEPPQKEEEPPQKEEEPPQVEPPQKEEVEPPQVEPPQKEEVEPPRDEPSKNKNERQQSDKKKEIEPVNVRPTTDQGEDEGATEGEGGEEEIPPSYNYEEMVSGPTISSPVDMPPDTLQLIYSFGYDSHKHSNLLSIDQETLIYTAGNHIILYNFKTTQYKYLRSIGGGGIGPITVHPSKEYFAVGEKGTLPLLTIYHYPTLALHRILREGTEQAYSHLDFNPDGSLLATVGGNPDYMLTVWDWKKENIVLRSKAFSQDIYKVSFSPELPGQLTTAGMGHIKFWKMATTFTGLKLQGYLGKFGRTELSDISAYVELPDGKVLSGCEWGNMLLWDGGFIKVELGRKGKKFCHNGNIECLLMDEGEIISAGTDGYIRIWDFESVDGADITEDSNTFELQPLTEIKVGSDVSIKSLTRSTDPDQPTLWYIQDAKGGIWKVDIVASHTRKAPEKLISFHSGEIKQVDCSPLKHWAASIAEDGSVRVYDMANDKVMCHTKYPSGGSSLIWAPSSVDINGYTLITGHTDGVVRLLKINETTSSSKGGWSPSGKLSLLIAIKPHTQSVTSLSVDKEGNILATGSDDGTVFFINIKKECSPIGFVVVPSAVAHIEWNISNKRQTKLLVCCKDGSVLEVCPPDVEGAGPVDTAQSYHLTSLGVVGRKMVSIKDRLRKEEAELKRAKEREEKRKKRLEEKEAKRERRKKEMGDDYESEEEPDEVEEEDGDGEEEEKEEGQEKAESPDPSSLLTAFYDKLDQTKFWISMGGYDAGYLYCYSLDEVEGGEEIIPYEPQSSIPIPQSNGTDRPLHSIIFSHSGRYMLTGSDDGRVRVHLLSSFHSLSQLNTHWSISMHDNHYGRLSAISLSFDDKYLITGGGDGNVFIYKTNFSKSKPVQPISGKFADEGLSLPSDIVDDITDPSHYSIEDAKQKEEHDRKMKAAEAKKQKVRREIVLLRRTYTDLQQRSQHLPSHLRLSKDEFIMDPSIGQQLLAQLRDKLELVEREMAWESEKHSLALKKLQVKYKDNVECDRIVVWTISDDGSDRYWVSTFRCVSPSPQYLALLDKIMSSDALSTPGTAIMGEKGTAVRRKTRIIDPLELDGLKEETDGNFDKELSKSELRRLRREKRKKEWEELYQTKPGDQYEDPEEVAAIERATQRMGDYKLKTSTDYVVSDQQRMSTEKKRRELIICRYHIFEVKKSFNQKLLALRDRKIKLVDKIREWIKELNEIQHRLPEFLHKPIPAVPELKHEEIPEKELEYTKETLLKFKKDFKAREKAQRQAANEGGEGFGGFGGFGGEGNEEDDESTSSSLTSVENTKKDQPTDANAPSNDDLPSSLSSSLTDLEKLLAQEEEIELTHKRDSILRDMEECVSEFNGAVVHLRHEKYTIDVTMKMMELKHLRQFEEIELLKEFEKRETNFTSKYKTKKKEKADLEEKIEEAEWEVQEKETLVSQLQEQEKNLDQAFFEAVGENNKFKDFLVKVYRKKIKRAKQRMKEEKEATDENGEEEEETESEYSSSEEDSDDDEDGFDDSTCPPGCDPNLFNQTIQMREKRLDQEELLTEEKKLLDNLKKERDSHMKKSKTVESHVKNALQDLQAFQLKKQQRLNELDAIVILRTHQILHYHGNGEPPTSVSQCLVFSDTAMKGLSQRITELGVEKQQEKKRYKELRHQHVKLVRERKGMDVKVAALNEKANEMMMLKFGRIVNLEALEGLTTNKLIGELEEVLKEENKKYEKSKKKIEREVSDIQDELLVEIRRHTEKLDELNEVTNLCRQLEKELNERQKNLEMDDSLTGGLYDMEEKRRLGDIVDIQSREIQALQEEIKILSHKGGHILPPTQPPHSLSSRPPTLA